jgi:hypothetical protein
MRRNDQIEERLTTALLAVADRVPIAPPASWAEAKALRSYPTAQSEPTSPTMPFYRKRSGRVLISIGIVAGLAGAGTAAAAATGAFSKQATKVFRQFASIPEPASWGRLPGFDPRKEVLELTNPGPEGTTVSMWTYPVTADFECVAIVESKVGKATFPGKPGTGVSGGCGGGQPGGKPPLTTAPPLTDPTLGAYAGIWRSPAGNLYYLTGGTTPLGASRLELTYSNGTSQSIRTRNGWFVTVVPYSLWVGGFTGVFYDSSGKKLPGTETNR